MQSKITILKPVLPDLFDPKFGGSITESPSSPLKYYQPVIDHLTTFAINKNFWYIADMVEGVILNMGGAYDMVHGFSAENSNARNADDLFKALHPDDLPLMFAYGKYLAGLYQQQSYRKRIAFKPTLYARLLNDNMQYNWVMMQMINPITDTNGVPLFGLAFVTDISHIKTDGVCFMSIYDSSTNSCSHFFCDKQHKVLTTLQPLPKITKRGMDVLRLLSVGYNSKQIAAELGIAIKTVDNHRQHLLSKMTAGSTAELVAIAVKAGLI